MEDFWGKGWVELAAAIVLFLLGLLAAVAGLEPLNFL